MQMVSALGGRHQLLTVEPDGRFRIKVALDRVRYFIVQISKQGGEVFPASKKQSRTIRFGPNSISGNEEERVPFGSSLAPKLSKRLLEEAVPSSQDSHSELILS